jgi:hypothetical protein
MLVTFDHNLELKAEIMLFFQGLQRRLTFDSANLTASPAHSHIIAYMAPPSGVATKDSVPTVKDESVGAVKSLPVDTLGMVDFGLVQAGSVH